MPSNLIDATRNPGTSYRIMGEHRNEEGEQLYEVTHYPRTPDDIRQASYFRFDALPEWMQDCMRILDVAGENVRVDGVGVRVGEITYWLDADDFKVQPFRPLMDPVVAPHQS